MHLMCEATMALDATIGRGRLAQSLWRGIAALAGGQGTHNRLTRGAEARLEKWICVELSEFLLKIAGASTASQRWPNWQRRVFASLAGDGSRQSCAGIVAH